MQFRVRSYLMAGVGIVAASTIAIPQSVAPPSAAPRHESVALAAHSQPVNPLLKQQNPQLAAVQAAAELLPAAAFSSTEALTETLDTASAQVSALTLPGLESAIIGAYNAIMPWVDWGVNLGIYATQWIPVVNWFTPQISIFYYSLIRPIITSAVYNVAYWVGGSVSFLQGLSNFFNDTVNAGIGFVNAEIDWVLSFLPPFPPFPPFFSSLTAQSVVAQSVMEVMGASTAVEIPAPAEADLQEEDRVTGEDGTETPPAEPVDETVPQPEETDPVVPEPTTPAAPAGPEAEETEGAAPEAPVEQTPVETPETPVESIEAEPEDEVETPAPDVDLNNDLNNELKDDEKVDAKPESNAGADAEKDAEKDSDQKKPDAEKPDTKPDNKTESGSDG